MYKVILIKKNKLYLEHNPIYIIVNQYFLNYRYDESI